MVNSNLQQATVPMKRVSGVLAETKNNFNGNEFYVEPIVTIVDNSFEHTDESDFFRILLEAHENRNTDDKILVLNGSTDNN